MSRRFVALCGSTAVLVVASIAAVRAEEKGPPPVAPAVASFDRPVGPDQPAAERRLQGETEQVARRLGTMIRFLAYHRLEQGEEQKLLGDAAKTLGGLSKNEMAAVIAHLEASIKAPDEGTSTAEAKKAYDKHRDVVKNLKSLLLKYDTIKTLDQAAERLERGARDQNELRIAAQALANQLRDGTKRGQAKATEAAEQADTQGDLNRDLEAVFKALEKIPPFLNAEQKERLAASKATEKGKKIGESQIQAEKHLKDQQAGAAAMHQKLAADQLIELAHALRAQRDKLETLKEARAKLDKTLQAQEKVTEETAKPPQTPQRQFRGSPVDQAQRQARDMAAKEARLEFDAKDARDLVKDVAKDAADQVKKAEEAIRKAEDELNKPNPSADAAKEPQEKAAEELKAARDKLDDMIAKEEKKKSDPLEAVKDAIAKVEKLIKDETKAREKTEATKGTQTEKMPALSKEQKDLAKETDAVKNSPLPDKPEAKAALDKAEKAMDKAAKALDDKKGMDAVKNQDESIKDLQAAKKALEDQAKEIEKRRDEIAKLEDAAKRLDELAKKQEKVADAAKDADKAAQDGKADPKKEADELSRDQKPLKPEAKEIGDKVKDQVPEAGKKIDQAGEKMEAAEKNLDNQKLDPAAKEGQKAAEDLKDAAKEVAKALADKKAQEANDQAKIQPQVSPMNAADQVAKALEQTEKAQAEAGKAQQQLGDKPMGEKGEPMKNPAANLQKLQEQVAKKAGDLKKDDAEKAAGEAADALKMGDLPAALEAQQKALDALKPMPGDKPEVGDKGDKPMGDKPQGDKPMGDKPMGEKGMGEKGMGEKGMGEGMGMGMPDPAGAKTPGELGKAQQQIKDATEALKNAQEANAAAQAALQQAQAQAPQAVQPQLDKAAQQLGQAQQALQQATPGQAQPAQAQAQQALQQALQTLQAAQQLAQGMQPGMGMEPGMGMGMEPGMGMGMKPGMGMQPGMQPGMGMGMGPAQEKNEQKGKGDRQADGTLMKSDVKLNDVKGDGAFINLPARQREMIQQALSGTLPPEYGAMIRQYFMNVASGKPAAAPTAEKK